MACKVRERAKIRNRYKQVPHLNQDTIGESDKSTRKCRAQESKLLVHVREIIMKSYINRVSLHK